MLDLSNFFKQNPQFTGLGSADAILAVINAKTIEKRNSELQNFRSLGRKFGSTFVKRVLSSLDGNKPDPILKATHMALCTTGVDFSSPQVREDIDGLVTSAVISPEDATKLKALGVYMISPVEQFFGEGEVADLAAVTTAMAVVDRLRLLAEVGDRFNQLAAAIRGGAISTWDEAKAFFNA